MKKETKLKSFTISTKRFHAKKWSMDFLYRKYYNCSEISFYKAKKDGVDFDKNIYVKKYKDIFELGMIEKYLAEELNIHDISCLYKENSAKIIKFKKSSYLKDKTLNFLEKGVKLKEKGVELFDLRQLIFFHSIKKQFLNKLREEFKNQAGVEFI